MGVTMCAISNCISARLLNTSLDWFHIIMRLTVLGQFAKGAVLRTEAKDKDKKLQAVSFSPCRECSRETAGLMESWFLSHAVHIGDSDEMI
jgi:hypothetical protein